MSWAPDWNEIIAEKEYVYEQSAVEFALKKLGIPEQIHAVREYAESTTRERKLTFFALAMTTGFPMWLVARKFRAVDLDDAILDAKFPSSVLCKALDEAAADVPPELGEMFTGVVFSWPQRGKFKVVHNRPLIPESGGARRLWIIGREKRKVWLEDLESLLEELLPVDTWGMGS